MISVAPTQAGLIKSKKGLKRLVEAGFENMSLDFNVVVQPLFAGVDKSD